MGAAKDPITDLTPFQEAYCQALATLPSPTQDQAYRIAFNVGPDTLPATIYESASRLSANPKIIARIQQLRQLATATVVAKHAWTLDRLVTEAETQLKDAREGGWRGVSAGNGALELIARVTGLLVERVDARVEVGIGLGSLAALSPAELRQLIEQRERMLALLEAGVKMSLPETLRPGIIEGEARVPAGNSEQLQVLPDAGKEPEPEPEHI